MRSLREIVFVNLDEEERSDRQAILAVIFKVLGRHLDPNKIDQVKQEVSDLLQEEEVVCR